MIYLIDEKVERQRGYGWSNVRFYKYKSEMIRIVNYQELEEVSSEVILGYGNVVFLHDSFFKNLKISEKYAEIFKNKIRESHDLRSYVFFGGSYDSIYMGDRNLELKDDVFYSHLESYLKSDNKNVDILAYGENFEHEEFSHLKNEVWSQLFMMDDDHILSENEKFEILKLVNSDGRIKEILNNTSKVMFLKMQLNKWII